MGGFDTEKDTPRKRGGNMYPERCEYESRFGILPLIKFAAQELGDQYYQTRRFGRRTDSPENRYSP